jgi:hypothetical protein
MGETNLIPSHLFSDPNSAAVAPQLVTPTLFWEDSECSLTNGKPSLRSGER